jgi:hypothetical protein
MDLTKDTLKGIIAKIKTNLSALTLEENTGETELGIISDTLAQLGNDGIDTIQSLSVATTEAITRKKKIRTLEASAIDRQQDIETLQEEIAGDTTKEELKALRDFKASTVKDQIANFGTKLGKIKDHANFEKASKLLKLPKPDEKGEYDLADVSEEDMTHNLAKMGEWEALSLFGNGADETLDVDGKKKKVNIDASLAERIKGAKTQKEIETIQAEMQG